ncbi:MAG TPA: lipoyl synthase [Pirellulaceae bacterium]|jgi:lipoic acid synthetase|nr:lipoyl synthase [Pirellulaceae bacterium]
MTAPSDFELPVIGAPSVGMSAAGMAGGGCASGSGCVSAAIEIDHYDPTDRLRRHASGRTVKPIERPRLPRWLKREVPKGNADHLTNRVLDDLRLETVCESAKCPNRMECYSQRTATFMILGAVCTRSCSFCAVARGNPEAVERDEPERLAEAAHRLGLAHVVITSVTRDDLPDGGGEHFARCIHAVRAKTGATVEVLTPDFIDSPAGLDAVIAARPDVFNHNMETIPRLYRRVRGKKSDYAWTLELLRRIKAADPAIETGGSPIKTKSGLMLGIGETQEELLDALADLRSVGCDFLTLGQYLQPDSTRYLPVERYVPPEEFAELGRLSKAMGFKQVASGPFVRSSYHAREMAESF